MLVISDGGYLAFDVFCLMFFVDAFSQDQEILIWKG